MVDFYLKFLPFMPETCTQLHETDLKPNIIINYLHWKNTGLFNPDTKRERKCGEGHLLKEEFM